MHPFKSLRRWWQIQSGYEDTPLDGDTPAWIISLLAHLLVLALLTWLTLWDVEDGTLLSLHSAPPVADEVPLDELHFSDVVTPQIGAQSHDGTESPMSQTPALNDATEITTQIDPLSSVGEFAMVAADDPVTVGPLESPDDLVVQGVGTVGTTGAEGAIDRITHEILLSLEQRPTLVVWIFDQSGSLRHQRVAIEARFAKVYDELGVIAASGSETFRKHKTTPLLTSVFAFGQRVEVLTPKPTSDVEEIRDAVRRVQDDTSGRENVFTAVRQAADQFRRMRTSLKSRRNVMIIVFTDEAGDDVGQLDSTLNACRRVEMPVYVVGIPSPFGRQQAYVKYVDPDPKFDQTPQWAPVHQGPESLMPERLKLHITGTGQIDEPIDSGFGPYALTRLCYETGGIYFAVHPNRSSQRRVTRSQTAEMSAYLTRFFAAKTMRSYRPEYVSVDRYKRLLKENRARSALVEAATLSWTAPMDGVRRRFPKRSEAELANLLSVAQRDAARLQPAIRRICETLRGGQGDRDKLTRPRWRAGFDLAMGQALAVKVRTEGYNAMLAKAKSMKFQQEESDTWVLDPSDDVSSGSTLAKEAAEAKTYLRRVVQEHAGTPWAHLAQQELNVPLGWKWTELSQGINQPRPQRVAAGPNNALPRNEQRRMLPKPKPRRPPPAL